MPPECSGDFSKHARSSGWKMNFTSPQQISRPRKWNLETAGGHLELDMVNMVDVQATTATTSPTKKGCHKSNVDK